MSRILALSFLVLLAAAPPPAWTVSLRSAGAVTYGMGIGDAARVSGEPFVTEESGSDDAWSCGYVRPTRTEGVSFMTAEGRIVRADVRSRSIRTRSGIGVGSTEAEVRRAYGARIQTEPHPYGDAGDHYLIYVPRDRADQNYRLIFETFGGAVTSFRSGLLPAVGYIEGCL